MGKLKVNIGSIKSISENGKEFVVIKFNSSTTQIPGRNGIFVYQNSIPERNNFLSSNEFTSLYPRVMKIRDSDQGTILGSTTLNAMGIVGLLQQSFDSPRLDATLLCDSLGQLTFS